MDEILLELTSADVASFLSQIPYEIRDLEPVTELQCRFRVSKQAWKRLKALADKRGDTLKICREKGPFLILKRLLKRPVLVTGLALLLLFSLWVPEHIFFVRVQGNRQVPAQKILEIVQKTQLPFGVSRRQIRSEKIKNALLYEIPQLQWVGVNTYGCLAVISVREKELPKEENISHGIGSMVSCADAVVDSVTVTKGNALCKPGQAVKKGQVLISGYTDCGLYIQATGAEGEIYGLTERKVRAVFPTEYEKRTEKTSCFQKYILIIGKKQINFAKDSGISGTTCAKIEKSYNLMLPGGFSLPVTLLEQQLVSYAYSPVSVLADEFLQQASRDALQKQMIAGSVVNASETLQELSGATVLEGTYRCREMIGRFILEENEFQYGKNRGKKLKC